MADDVITNRKSGRDFAILETIEAGIVLKGTEVKSLRSGKGNLNDALARVEKDEVFLYNLDIQPYDKAFYGNHEAKARRKLLLNKSEIRRLFGLVSIKNRALVPLRMYWKNRKLKVLLGVGDRKTHGDKRDDLKKAVAKREIDQALKEAKRRG